MDPVDDLMFAIALAEANLKLQLRSRRLAVALDVGESLKTVDVGLAFPQ
jgi:hypothetical protein